MKVAILSESKADDAAIKVLIQGILRREVEVLPRRARTGGWPEVFRLVPPTLKELHYHRSAEVLIVVVDTDDSPLHEEAHERPAGFQPQCRVCELTRIVDQIRPTLKPIPNRPDIKVAIAAAAPAIEAWYAHGLDPGCTDAGWILQTRAKKSAKIVVKRLKRLVYGSDRPGTERQVQKAVEHATRLVADIELLERAFPQSLGLLIRTIRGW